LTGIRKSFDGAIALDGAVFAARAGEVHALLGENGAGKSSLMNVAAGLYAPDAGRIAIGGHTVALAGPADARRHGIGMVHQHFKLVKPFTIAENILLANPRPHFVREFKRFVPRSGRRRASSVLISTPSGGSTRSRSRSSSRSRS
jgi:general nucleoside transport system ATP-binding protein